MNQPTEWDICALRLQGDLPAYLRGAHAKAVADCKQRRTRVLANPEAAAQVATILGLAFPSQWSGYLPPERDCTGRPNDSPIRAALAQVVAEAELREAS